MAAEVAAAASANPYATAALIGFQLINGLQQAELTRQQGEINREVAEMNAQYAENDAYVALAAGLTEEARYSGVIANVLANQTVIMEAAGIDTGYGSAAALQADTKVQGIVNQATIRNNAYAQALGLKREALNIRLQGQFGQSAAAQKASAQQAMGVMGALQTGVAGYGIPGATTKVASTADTSSLGSLGDYGLEGVKNIDNYNLGNYGFNY